MQQNQKLEPVRETIPLQQRCRNLAATIVSGVQNLGPQQRMWAGAAAAVVTLLLAGLIWYAARPDWRTLYAGLDPQDARELAAQLTAANIPFEVSPDGSTLRVTAEYLDKARLQTTAKGGPKSGRMGFELFDKPNWVGSEFDEKVNYQRALEGELEHTVATLGAVQSARVHLVLPHDSLFNDQQRAAKASVVLKLKHRSLSSEEADSVRNLVASAVDELRPEDVVLVDADGHLPVGQKGADAQNLAHEQALTAKLVETLEPVAGVGNVRASVNVEYDHTTADETDETYDPNSSVALSMQRSEQSTGAQPVAAGVPGTASNAPNAQPPLYPQQMSSPQSVKQESGTYGVSKKVRHSVEGEGRVHRITAAIVVNDRFIGEPGKGGRWQSRSPDEMKHIVELAQAAVGFDVQRGDMVTVENLAFDENSAAAAAGMQQKIAKRTAQLMPLGRYATILLVTMAILLLIVRPMTGKLTAAVTQGVLPAGQAGANAQLPATPEEQAALMQELTTEKQKQRAQLLYEQVSEHLKKEPAQSSRLLQSWIQSD